MDKGLRTILAVGVAGVSMAATTVVENCNLLSQNNVIVAQASKRSRINKAVSIMQDNYDDKAKVYYDKENDIIAIKPTDEDFEEAVLAVMNGEASKSDWKDLTDSIDDLSETIHDKLHIKTPVAIVNPENPDKVLYASYDGSSMYDVMDDNN